MGSLRRAAPDVILHAAADDPIGTRPAWRRRWKAANVGSSAARKLTAGRGGAGRRPCDRRVAACCPRAWSASAGSSAADTVLIVGPATGPSLAASRYSAADLRSIAGCRSDQIAERLGYRWARGRPSQRPDLAVSSEEAHDRPNEMGQRARPAAGSPLCRRPPRTRRSWQLPMSWKRKRRPSSARTPRMWLPVASGASSDALLDRLLLNPKRAGPGRGRAACRRTARPGRGGAGEPRKLPNGMRLSKRRYPHRRDRRHLRGAPQRHHRRRHAVPQDRNATILRGQRDAAQATWRSSGSSRPRLTAAGCPVPRCSTSRIRIGAMDGTAATRTGM